MKKAFPSFPYMKFHFLPISSYTGSNDRKA